ncbi:hypothetical protein FN960_20395 [Alkalicoccobacillus porphyridii]|uniref:Uncharacterized protein n=2 Tax=Alkalicoccobacillus porphyridii TaxID=2597270 RepID=A0A553ZT59_9BACI|nr:hypothetical protein FN960_20395 [Alkalicoccobacillus porphyridii]
MTKFISRTFFTKKEELNTKSDLTIPRKKRFIARAILPLPRIRTPYQELYIRHQERTLLYQEPEVHTKKNLHRTKRKADIPRSSRGPNYEEKLTIEFISGTFFTKKGKHIKSNKPITMNTEHHTKSKITSPRKKRFIPRTNHVLPRARSSYQEEPTPHQEENRFIKKKSTAFLQRGAHDQLHKQNLLYQEGKPIIKKTTSITKNNEHHTKNKTTAPRKKRLIPRRKHALPRVRSPYQELFTHHQEGRLVYQEQERLTKKNSLRTKKKSDLPRKSRYLYSARCASITSRSSRGVSLSLRTPCSLPSARQRYQEQAPLMKST